MGSRRRGLRQGSTVSPFLFAKVKDMLTNDQVEGSVDYDSGYKREDERKAKEEKGYGCDEDLRGGADGYPDRS